MGSKTIINHRSFIAFDIRSKHDFFHKNDGAQVGFKIKEFRKLLEPISV